MTPSQLQHVSVVIPVRNRPDLLDRALRSVRDQALPDLEIIVVDDASDVPLSLANDDVTVIRNRHVLGAQRSRLIGAEVATGNFVALLDSDDWWHPDKLRRQLALAEAEPDAVVCCRVVAARGSLRKAAPWRPIARDEKVEEFLYVHQGMLQTSTVLGRRKAICDLLRSSADSRVHNDTMLFLEAQRRGLRILQMHDALSFFDDNPRSDRVSYDRDRVQASEAWFHAVSPDWSSAARSGFMLNDMVTRHVNTGHRLIALRTLFRAYHPDLATRIYLKKLLSIIFKGPPSRFLNDV